MEIPRSLQNDFVETGVAKETVLFSNTASFLLSRLQKDTSAAYVADRLSTDEIINWLFDACKNPPDNAIALLRIYVFLAALSLKDDLQQYRDKLRTIDFTHVQWGNEIRTVITEAKTPTNVLDIQYQGSFSSSEPISMANHTDVVVVGAE